MRDRGVAGEGCRLDQLRQAEVEQFHDAIDADENIRCLDVAMNDEIAMRVLCRFRGEQKKLDPAADGGSPRVAVGIDRLSLDVLQHEIRLTHFSDAAVQQTPDVRMIQRRENLPLGPESGAVDVGIETGTQQFERDILLELPVRAPRQKDARHSASPDLADERVGADAAAQIDVGRRSRFRDGRRSDGRRRRCQVVARVVEALEQFLDLSSEIRRADAHRIEHFRPTLWCATERGVEHLSDALPAISLESRGHAQAEPPEDPGAVGPLILARRPALCESECINLSARRRLGGR